MRPQVINIFQVMDNRLIAVIRAVLATLTLLIMAIDPTEVAPRLSLSVVFLLYLTYLIYIAGSVFLATSARRHRLLFARTLVPWVDMAWYVLLIWVGGTYSIFFFSFFLVFSILLASLYQGFYAGLRLTCIAVLLLSGSSALFVHLQPGVPWRHILLWPAFLLVLGYLMAYWGGAEYELRCRLALLQEVSVLANPRFGIDRTLGMFLEKLRAFYDATACLLIMADPLTHELLLRRADFRAPEAAEHAEPVPATMAQLLLAVPEAQSILAYSPHHFWKWWYMGTPVQAYELSTGEYLGPAAPASAQFDALCYMTVPTQFHGKTAGRLYIMTPRRPGLDATDLSFLHHVLTHMMPIIDNISLVDRLASEAAETERQRIAYDLHDSIIQPYIGLQLGLRALRQRYQAGNRDMGGDIERLLTMSSDSIAELRQYVRELRVKAPGQIGLLAAIQQFAHKFTEATGIMVHVVADNAQLQVNDRLAAEVFQMIAEGLSNVRRHTSSIQATVSLTRSNDQLVLNIANDVDPQAAPVSFTPRSILERAAGLGGTVHVAQQPDHQASVTVSIPL